MEYDFCAFSVLAASSSPSAYGSLLTEVLYRGAVFSAEI